MPYRHFFSAFASHVSAIILAGGYPFLFLSVLLEGIPLVGTAVPGHVTIIAAGFLAKVGLFNIWWVLILSITGAILGDCIGFFLGRKYGLSLIDRLRPYFFITDAHIAKVNVMLEKHTGKALIIGRFSPITRPLMPFFVGASPTPVKKFWLYNAIGGVSWAGLSVMLGYLFGASYGAISAYFGKFVLAAIIVAVLIIWGYRFVNVRFHIFRKYELFALALNLLSLYTLAKMVQDVLPKYQSLGLSVLARFDVYVNSFMAEHVNRVVANISYWISIIGGTWITSILGVMIGLIFAIREKWRSSAIMLLSIASTAFMVGAMKEFFMQSRPYNALYELNDYSFPSGHAAMSAAFFIALAYLLAPKIRSWVWRELFLVACVLTTIAIGLSRIALNVHWASDVIAGWSLGVFFASGSILLVKYVGVLMGRKDS